jgi:hydrogenase expression/formation protein HypE
MNGAVPKYLSISLIIEEGLSMSDLQRVVASIKDAAVEAEVQIVAGDTKVVNKGSADKLFINTAGIGIIAPGVDISGSNARHGDKVVLSGPIGDHGIAVISQREGLQFSSPVESDCAPLNKLVAEMLDIGAEVHCLRDPTRGGLASTLNELASSSWVGIRIEEDSIPVREAVQAACELLGFDPLYVANEGKLVAVVGADSAQKLLDIMRRNRYGAEAAIIGEVVSEHPGRVVMKTKMGASRIVDMLVGELLPRIC